jgi:hypothetical protein
MNFDRMFMSFPVHFIPLPPVQNTSSSLLHRTYIFAQTDDGGYDTHQSYSVEGAGRGRPTDAMPPSFGGGQIFERIISSSYTCGVPKNTNFVKI